MKEQVLKTPKFINLRTDFGFKKLFFEDPNKDLLIAFLNALFKGRKVIKDLTYNKTEFPGDITTEGSVIFDLACTGENGERFIIEVQRTKKDNFKKRALFYSSRLISSQAPVGNRAVWNYNIDEVFLVALLDGFMLEGTSKNEYLHDICLCNRETGETFYDGLGYIYIELLKFVKQEHELETDLDKWLYVLKNMNDLQKVPVFLRKTIFEKVFKIATYINLTEEEKMLYDLDLKKQWDDYSALETAKKEGFKEGERKKAIETATEMKKDGFDAGQIRKFTKLSMEEIEKL
jgi:predicted transposase/invertase (TIGR01784 family)